MDGLWLQDIESLEAISQDDDTRKLFLQMAEMSKAGRLGPFLVELNDDEEIDDQTKGKNLGALLSLYEIVFLAKFSGDKNLTKCFQALKAGRGQSQQIPERRRSPELDVH